MYDILIVGGGIAGLTAAVYARRAGRTALVLEGMGLGGQIAASPLVENYPGVASISGSDLSDALAGQAKALGAEVKYGQATAAEKTAGGRWHFTPKGFLVSNQLIGELLERQEKVRLDALLPRVQARYQGKR